jgi:arylsulfatase A-like enzyme
MDDQVGRVLDALERSGRATDTIVLFTADHGDMCGGHGMMLKAVDAFYEELVRVPFIVRWPAALSPSALNVVGNLTDTMPTLLDLVGHPIPGHVEGTSLAPFLRGERAPDDGPAYTYCERLPANPERQRRPVDLSRGSYMVRGQEWKYCRYADGDEMLFNLCADPGETINLISSPKHQTIKEQLRRELDTWLGSSQP